MFGNSKPELDYGIEEERPVFTTNKRFFVIAGPCVIESAEHVLFMAKSLKEYADKYSIDFVFKSSFDKANRTSVNSYRGPGLESGLEILQEAKDKFNVKILSDIHEPSQAKRAAEVLDIIQIPAFLCRQTDLLVAAGKTGKIINVKKGQFMSPEDMRHSVEKVKSTGNKQVFTTERGSSFGYNNLVVDFRSLVIMKQFSDVVFDCTHSVQLPGGGDSCSSGDRRFIFPLLRAALGVGVDGLFMEVHDQPDKALCDGPNMIPLNDIDMIFKYISNFNCRSADYGRYY